MHISFHEADTSPFPDIVIRATAPSLHDIQAANAVEYPGAQIVIERSQVGMPANESFERARSKQWETAIRQRTAGYLENLPERCQSCLSSVAMNLAVSVTNGTMSGERAHEVMQHRRRLATAMHRGESESRTDATPPGQTSNNRMPCRLGNLLLPNPTEGHMNATDTRLTGRR